VFNYFSRNWGYNNTVSATVMGVKTEFYKTGIFHTTGGNFHFQKENSRWSRLQSGKKVGMGWE